MKVDKKTSKIFEIQTKYGSPSGEISFSWLASKLGIGERRIKRAIKEILENTSKDWKEVWLKQKGMLKDVPPLVRFYRIKDEIFISIHSETDCFTIPLTNEATINRRKWVEERRRDC